jgi:hypothetical protein
MTISKLKAKLHHPLALVAQGFIGGVILFWATAPSAEAHAAPPAPAAIHATR